MSDDGDHDDVRCGRGWMGGKAEKKREGWLLAVIAVGRSVAIRRHSLHRTTVRAQLNFRPTATSTSPNLAVRMALIVLCRFLKIRN